MIKTTSRIKFHKKKPKAPNTKTAKAIREARHGKGVSFCKLEDLFK